MLRLRRQEPARGVIARVPALSTDAALNRLVAGETPDGWNFSKGTTLSIRDKERVTLLPPIGSSR